MRYLNALILGVFFTAVCFGESGWKADASRGKNSIKFVAQGFPSALSIEGKGEEGVSGELVRSPTGLQGTFSVALDKLETGMSLRDRHMKEKYLETGKYPVAKLTFTEFRLPASFQGKTGSVANIPFRGKFSIHGVEKVVQGVADLQSDGKLVSLGLTFNLDIRHYQIKEPSFSGISVKPEVAVSVRSEMPLR